MDVGVIGVGAMGRNHARVYSELKAVDDVFLHDVDGKAAESVAAAHGAVACDTLDALLRQVDAVSLCVPTPHHASLAAAVLDAGVHLLIEKPIAATAAEARAMTARIPDDLVVGVGHIERFNPVVDEITRIATRPLYMEIRRHNPASGRITDASVIEDLMIHDLDLVAHVLCDDLRLVAGAGDADIAVALFQGDGVPVSISASRKASRKIRSIYIEEEDATIEGDFMSQEVFVYRKPGEYRMDRERYLQENVIEKVLVNRLEPLKRELEVFGDCIRRGQPFPVTPAQATANLALCEEITAAQRGGR